MKNACSHATLLAVALLFSACRKEGEINYNNYPDRLTCKVNGQDWQPQGDDGPFGFPYFNVQYHARTGRLSVWATSNTPSASLTFGVDSLQIGSNQLNRASWSDLDFHNPDCYLFTLDSLGDNDLSVSEIDTTHKVIKATFRFTLVNFCGDKTIVTTGVLDVTPFWNP